MNLTNWWLESSIGLLLGFILGVLVLIFRCKHSWELVDKSELPAPWDSLPPGTTYDSSDLKWLLRKTVVLALRCPKCGASKIEKISNT
jgi:rubredoxin